MTISTLRQTIGKRVHELRIQNHCTQAEFAERIDISVNFLSEIENGKKGMSQETICKICRTFDVSADYLLFGTASAPNDPRTNIDELISLANTLSQKELDLVIEYFSSLRKLKSIAP